MKNYNVTLFECETLKRVNTIIIFAVSAEEARQNGERRLNPIKGQQFVGAEPAK